MKEKNVTKISLSTFLLIIAIIAIIIMGIFIYKLNNDKATEIQKSTELQSQVNSLNGTVSDLQGKINNISETINSHNSSLTNEVSNSKTEERNYKDVILTGRYEIPNTDSGLEFTKDGKAYSCGNMNVMKGTYETIEKNSVKIHYTENKVWDETGKESIEKIDTYEYITVDSNENIYLKDSNNENVKLEKYSDTALNAY